MIVIHTFDKVLKYDEEILKYVCENDEYVDYYLAGVEHYLLDKQKISSDPSTDYYRLIYSFDDGHIAVTSVGITDNGDCIWQNSSTSSNFVFGSFDTDFEFNITDSFVEKCDSTTNDTDTIKVHHTTKSKYKGVPSEANPNEFDALYESGTLGYHTKEFIYTFGLYGLKYYTNRLNSSIMEALKTTNPNKKEESDE